MLSFKKKGFFMLKNVFIMMSIITFHLNGMETPHLCIFKKIPVKTIDYIATFLTHNDIESEIDFVERTKVEERKFLPNSCIKYLISPNIGCVSSSWPDTSTIALLQTAPCMQEGMLKSSLFIVDKNKDQLLYRQDFHDKKGFDRSNYLKVALSRDANTFATIHNQLNSDKYLFSKKELYLYTQKWCSQYIVTIHNIPTQLTHTIDITHHNIIYPYRRLSIDFNKQGTHIVICNDKNDQISCYNIIRFTTLLDEYFARRLVCKHFSQQLPYKNYIG